MQWLQTQLGRGCGEASNQQLLQLLLWHTSLPAVSAVWLPLAAAQHVPVSSHVLSVQWGCGSSCCLKDCNCSFALCVKVLHRSHICCWYYCSNMEGVALPYKLCLLPCHQHTQLCMTNVVVARRGPGPTRLPSGSRVREICMWGWFGES